MRNALTALLLLLVPILARPAEAPPAAADPVVEERLMSITSELRCLVCQNQSLADSHADLAVDLRNEVREQIKAGKSDDQIRAWMTARYGDFVLYRPPLKATTVLLWVGPFVLLVMALVALVLYLRRRRRLLQPPLSAQERARAQALLRADDPAPGSTS